MIHQKPETGNYLGCKELSEGHWSLLTLPKPQEESSTHPPFPYTDPHGKIPDQPEILQAEKPNGMGWGEIGAEKKGLFGLWNARCSAGIFIPLGIWNTNCGWNGAGMGMGHWIGLQAARPYGQSQSNRNFWGFGKSFKHLKTGIMGKLVLPAANPPGTLGIDSRAPTEWEILEQELGQKSFQGWRCEDLSIKEVFGNARIRSTEGEWVGFRAPQQSGIEGGMGFVLLLWDIGDEGLSQLHGAGVWKCLLEHRPWLLDAAGMAGMVLKYGTGKL